jgi:GH25 family lysozyme M1 (1,4-beta-N-acetylmuramidase)
MDRPNHRRRSAPAALGLSLLVALIALPSIAVPAALAATSDYTANCDARLRASASVDAAIVDTISSGATVSASGTVAGGAYSADCPTTVSGTDWLVITAVNGASVSSLYGRSPVYAAAKLFSAVAPTTSSYLDGIDVSHWQGTIDWTKVAAAGKKFAFVKATESTTFLDSQYAANHAHARAVGIRTGAYHFAQPSSSTANAVAQADWFVANMNLTPGDLFPALDLEVRNGLTNNQLVAWTQAFMTELYAKTGVKGAIYTSPSFWSSYMNDTAWFANNGYTVLWIAHWFVSAPRVPAGNWGGKGWTFWQYSDCGKVAGIGGGTSCVDLDHFNGLDLTRVTFGANFSVASGPASQSIEQGGAGGVSVSVDRDYFTLPISLTVSGLPSGTTVTSGTSALTSGSTSYGFSVGSSTPVGTYPITVTGTANGLTRTATSTLVVTDSRPPTLVAPFPRLYAGSVLSSTTPVRSSWSATDASGIAGYALQHQVDGGPWNPVSLTGALATSSIESLSFGHAQRDQVQATDGVGNATPWTAGPTITPQLTQQWSSAVRYTAGWKTALATYASGGSLKYASANGSSASYTFSGSAISWVTYRGPNRGKAAVYVDGAYKGTIDLYATKYLARQVVYAYNWTANGTHTIKVVCLGTAGRPRVDIDAFVRLVR